MGTLKTIVKEHIEWKYQILKLAKADIIKTYSGAALGWFWAIIKPAVTIFVFWFAFSFGLRQSQDVSGVPYALWIISGMLPWFYMSEMITQGANSISQYRYLVTKMKYPVSTIPTFVGLSKLAVHICLFIIVVAIFCCFGFYPDKYMLQLPLYMYFMVQYFVVWGLFSALLSAVSKDFLNLVRAFVQAIFWMSGIMWDLTSTLERLDSPVVSVLLQFNPVTYIATGYRNVFIYKQWFWEDPYGLLYFGISFLIMSVLAVWCYRKLIREIPDFL